MLLALLISFVAGASLEWLYAVGVTCIANGRRLRASLASMAWGVCMIAGAVEMQHHGAAAVAWIIGLGVGCYFGTTSEA